MSHRVRSWTAALAVIMALVAAPAAIVTIQTAGLSRADVCGDVGGRHVDVGGCTDPGAVVDAPPPPEYVAPPPEDAAPPPEYNPPPAPPAPDATACADVGGRHVSVGGCT